MKRRTKNRLKNLAIDSAAFVLAPFYWIIQNIGQSLALLGLLCLSFEINPERHIVIALSFLACFSFLKGFFRSVFKTLESQLTEIEELRKELEQINKTLNR